MNLRTFSCLAGVLSLVGCMHTELQQYAGVDRTEKTVTVPTGSNGLKGGLKKVLHEDGWLLKVDSGPEVRESDVSGGRIVQKEYDTFHSRYRLNVNSTQYDTCVGLGLSPAIVYDISFIDNKTGAEVFTISGKDCQPEAVEKFHLALKAADPT